MTRISNELHQIRAITERWSVDQRWSLLLTRLSLSTDLVHWFPGLMVGENGLMKSFVAPVEIVETGRLFARGVVRLR